MTSFDPPSSTSSPAAPSSALDIVENSDGRLVVHIPPQGSAATRGIGAFAAVWTLFSTVLSGFFFVVGFGPARAGFPMFVLFVPLLFVGIGIGMLYAWARMRHTRLFVLVDPARVAVQRQFFRRKSETEVGVEPKTHAALVEAYSVNDVPVHAVAIQGASQVLKFGAGLPPEDKAWLVEQINAIVCPARTADDVPVCSRCGAVLPVTDNLVPEEADCPACGGREVVRPVLKRETPIPEIRPERGDAVPDEIQLHEASVEELAFSVPLVPISGIRQGVGWATAIILVIALAIFGPSLYRTVLSLVAPAAQGAPVAGGVFPIVIHVLELVHGTLFVMVPALILLTVVRGRIDVRLTRDRLAMGWGAGWFGFRRRIRLDEIDDVRLVRPESAQAAKRQRANGGSGAAAVIVKGQPWILTTLHSQPVALAAAGLVRTRLVDWGILAPGGSPSNDELPWSPDEGEPDLRPEPRSPSL